MVNMCKKVLGSVLSIGGRGGVRESQRDGVHAQARVVLEELQLLKVISYSVVGPPSPKSVLPRLVLNSQITGTTHRGFGLLSLWEYL